MRVLICLSLLLPAAPWQSHAQPSPDPLRAFHSALERASSTGSRARVVVYGASHTAGDEFTSEVRRRLQARFGDAGPGWVLPASPFPYYHHARVQIAARGWQGVKVRGSERARTEYGYAGFAVDARDAESELTADSPIDRLEVHYLGRPRGGEIELRAGGTVLATIDTSIERGPVHRAFELEQPTQRVSLNVRGGPVRVFGLVMERNTKGVVLDAFGVPGARVWDQHPWREGSMQAGLATRPPDLWAMAYGTNESANNRLTMREYRQRLDRAVRRWKRWAPHASCLLIGPGEWPRRTRRGWVRRPRTTEVIGVQRRVANDHDCAFFDTLAMMGGEGSMVQWVAQGLAIGDHVHFTEAGYRRLGAALHTALTR